MDKEETKSVYFAKGETTFAKDEKLPNLPVPDLSQTLSKYVESVKPFVKSAQFEKTKSIVNAFEKGIGKELHEKLLLKAKTEKNWLKTWWEDYAYLVLRDPLLPYYSMAGSLGVEALPWAKNSTRLQQASLYTYYLIEFWKLLVDEKLAPTKNTEKKYFNMDQFKQFFNTCRQTGREKDGIKSYFVAGSKCPSHVVVMCKGHFYKIDVMLGQGGLLTAPEWECHLSYILNNASENEVPYIARLTTDNRTNWARNREWLSLLSQNNRNILECIDSAILLLVLDDGMPASESGALQQTLNIDYNNRWLDKSLSIIFFKDSTVGSLCDHAAYDGMVSITAFHYVLLALQECRGQWLGSNQVFSSLPPPQEVKFDVDSLVVEQINTLGENVYSNPLVCVIKETFLEYGKLFTQTHKLSSDAYVQLALQLAYYKLHKKLAPVYETASTRQFFCGRTETVRSCTQEALVWMQHMCQSARDINKTQMLLRNAIIKHNKLMKEARNGLGCDRHLFGLQCIAMEAGIPMPELYKDPAYSISGGGGNFVLSTSLVGFTANGGSVAPMCLDGYGCFYSICKDRIYFSISAWKQSYETSAYKFYSMLVNTLLDMQNMLGFVSTFVESKL